MKDVIKNIAQLCAIFENGEIPSFHDAEIVSILLNREDNVSIETVILIYRVIEEYKIGEKKIIRRKNAYCSFRFEGVKVDILRDFNHQNVINDINISPEEDSDLLRIHFQSIFGCDLKFSCREIELTRVRVSESVKEHYEPNLEELKKRLQAAKKSENKD
jgi:hypothetical protein